MRVKVLFLPFLSALILILGSCTLIQEDQRSGSTAKASEGIDANAMAVNTVTTVYYVDSVGGNDSNNGTSESTAWKTLSKVNNTTFTAGNMILFKKGGSWSGQLLPKGSGSSGSPIVISNYGTGADPIIDGAGASWTIMLTNQQYWEIYSIEVMNTATTKAMRIGLYITAANAGTLNHIYVRNVYFHDIVSRSGDYTPGQVSAGTYTGGIVGYISGTTTPTRYNDVRIENCKFVRTDRNMFYFFESPWKNDSELGMTSGAGAMFNSTNVVVRNNYAKDIPGTGTCLCACDGAVIEYNVIDNCQYNVPSDIAGVACSTWASQFCIYQYNEVMNTHGLADGQSFDNDGACRKCVFQYNYSHDNNGGFFLVCSGSDCKVFDSVCRYNISQNDLNGIFDHRASSYRTMVYNNVIYIKSGASVKMFRSDTSSTYGTAAFVNNIFYNLGSTMSGPYGSFSWTNNVFYGNFSSYPSGAVGSKTSNPLMVNPGSGGSGTNIGGVNQYGNVDGYKLQTNSPCINSGVSVANNGGKDYWGNTIYFGNPDIGAYEYQSSVSSSSSSSAPAVKVTLTSYFNADGFSYDAARSNGNFDSSGYTYSADLVTNSFTFGGVPYQFGSFTAGSKNDIRCSNQTVTLTSGIYSMIQLIGSATAGDKTGTFRINYSDGTYSDISMTLKDWCTGSSGSTVVQRMAHRHSQTADSSQVNYIFGYSLAPTGGKTVTSLKLPNNTGMHIFAVTLVP